MEEVMKSQYRQALDLFIFLVPPRKVSTSRLLARHRLYCSRVGMRGRHAANAGGRRSFSDSSGIASKAFLADLCVSKARPRPGLCFFDMKEPAQNRTSTVWGHGHGRQRQHGFLFRGHEHPITGSEARIRDLAWLAYSKFDASPVTPCRILVGTRHSNIGEETSCQEAGPRTYFGAGTGCSTDRYATTSTALLQACAWRAGSQAKLLTGDSDRAASHPRTGDDTEAADLELCFKALHLTKWNCCRMPSWTRLNIAERSSEGCCW